MTAASMELGKKGIIHGSFTYLMQTGDGQIEEPYSVSAGLDYPGVGPVHAYLRDSGKATMVQVTDEEALKAARFLSQTEGIIPALETAHAVAYLNQMEFKKEQIVVVNLSGRGDKDMATYQKFMRDGE